jgi:hypothetical protein
MKEKARLARSGLKNTVNPMTAGWSAKDTGWRSKVSIILTICYRMVRRITRSVESTRYDRNVVKLMLGNVVMVCISCH